MKFRSCILVTYCFVVLCAAQNSKYNDINPEISAACLREIGVASKKEVFSSGKGPCYHYCKHTKNGKLILNSDYSIDVQSTLAKISKSHPYYNQLQTVYQNCQNAGKEIADFCTRGTQTENCIKTEKSNAGIPEKHHGFGRKHKN